VAFSIFFYTTTDIMSPPLATGYWPLAIDQFPMPNRRKQGDDGEIIAIQYLQKHDYEIVETNYTIQGGEIDIVAKLDGKYIFIEVKFRTNSFF